MLDAYSRAAIAVVDNVGPAIVSISIGQAPSPAGLEAEGAGSGFVDRREVEVIPAEAK